MISVDEWILQGKNYQDGVELLAKLPHDAYLLTLLRAGRSSFTEAKLERALLALKDKDKPVAVKRAVPPAARATAVAAPAEPPAKVHSMPKEVAELERRWKQAYKEANDLRYSFKGHSQGKRHVWRDIAFEILEKMDFVQQCWRILDEYRDTGRMPAAAAGVQEQVAAMGLMDLLRRSDNIKTYLVKARKRLGRATKPAALAKVKKRIDDYELEAALIAARLEKIDKEVRDGVV